MAERKLLVLILEDSPEDIELNEIAGVTLRLFREKGFSLSE